MYILFMVLTGINMLVYFYAFIKDLQIIIDNKLFKKAFEAGQKIGEDVQKTYEEQTDNKKGAYVIGVILAIIFLFLLYVAVIYVPVWIGLKYGISNAIATYLLFLTFTTTLRLYKYGTNPKFDAKKMILMSLVGLFRFQVMTLVLFGFNFTLNSIVRSIYESNFFLNDTFTIIYPILFFSSIVVTIYLFWIGLKVNSNLNVNDKFKPRLSHFMLIVIASSFIGLIYIIEADLSFIDNTSGSSLERIQNLFMVLLASILIPILFNLISNNSRNVDVIVETAKTEGYIMDDFKGLISEKIKSMKGKYVELISGEIHREIGGYPGANHRMPTCCNAMRELMNSDDEILHSPKKGNGATLKIRYYRRTSD
ncbi:MAG: hypothetical protein AB7E09_08030 [Candidatus Izemoplasmatales bacterium]